LFLLQLISGKVLTIDFLNLKTTSATHSCVGRDLYELKQIAIRFRVKPGMRARLAFGFLGYAFGQSRSLQRPFNTS